MALPQDSSQTTIIVGAGIVGSALAAFLSEDPSNGRILLVDRSFSEVLGSTGYAPGFLGQFNESKALTKLAVDSLKDYERFPDTFSRVGGLELAATDEGVKLLESRCERANEAGVAARILSLEEHETIVPDFVHRDSFKKALHFPTDGVADPKALCLAYRAKARQNGVDFLEANVAKLQISDNTIRGVETTSTPLLSANKVILATGIWSSLLAASATPTPLTIPAIPVAHPYVYTPSNPTPKPSTPLPPFVRWPESHIYARRHDTRYGLGSYAHRPIPIRNPHTTALEPWPPATFNPVIATAAAAKTAPDSALALLATEHAPTDPGVQLINGLFSLTPDGLPIVGCVPGVQGLSLAVAVWITHAAGCARFLTRVLRGKVIEGDLQGSLDPGRFAGSDEEELREKALGGYCDIYGSARGERGRDETS
ncbi:hypothetical protein MBLNU230_g4102t1 [Neophaeotheca triangularis]